MENEFDVPIQFNGISFYVYLPKIKIMKKLGLKKGDYLRLKIIDMQKRESE